MHHFLHLGSQVAFFIHLIRAYSYFIIFLLVAIEGPATIFLTGFLISLGYLNPTLTFITAVSADLFGDIIYYGMGRWWLHSVSDKVLKFFRVGPKSFEKFRLVFHKHKGKIMFFGKLSSFVGGLVMYVAGFVRVSLPEFIVINASGALFKTLLLLLAGYYLGDAVLRMGSSFDVTTSAGLLILSAVIFAVYWGIKSLANKYIKRVEK
jgi:membrane protein DedA with SNARE-associated domain